MKLLLITQVVDKNHPILGFFHNWILAFAEKFEEVHVICLQKGECALPPHVFVYSLGKEDGVSRVKYLYRFYRYFGHVFFKVKVQFVFFHMCVIYNTLAAPFFLMRSFFGTKFYWWKTHGTLTPFGRLALCFVDRIYTASRYSFPLETKKKHVVGHAIDIVDASVLFAEKQNPPVLLFVGRVTPVKKVELVIETASVLNKRGIVTTVRIVGGLFDPVYEKMLREKIAHSGIEQNIIIVGAKTYADLPQEYKNATILINPSETGGIDKVVLEAMQYGVPAIARAKTYGELLQPFGLAATSQNAEEYADIVEKLLSDSSRRESLKTSLRSEVVENHALSTLTKRIFNI